MWISKNFLSVMERFRKVIKQILITKTSKTHSTFRLLFISYQITYGEDDRCKLCIPYYNFVSSIDMNQPSSNLAPNTSRFSL